jgi:hypothetical protein
MPREARVTPRDELEAVDALTSAEDPQSFAIAAHIAQHIQGVKGFPWSQPANGGALKKALELGWIKHAFFPDSGRYQVTARAAACAAQRNPCF